MNKDVSTPQHNQQVDELCEDMVMVGPGQMLSEARQKLSLSHDDIADKLNFKKCLVANIEQDVFDHKLPATFNRGYLRSYAKLVNVDTDEVLSAYDMLDIAEVQRSEMQSFSNLTVKQAEHSRLMWLSYLIVAVLFGLMVLWWLQAPESITTDELTPTIKQEATNSASLATEPSQVSQEEVLVEPSAEKESAVASSNEEQPTVSELLTTDTATSTVVANVEEQVTLVVEPSVQDSIDENLPVAVISTAIFTFTGDCWVNIYDATGERIAWGVKKSGYVMTISGKEPLKVTLGRPELATIVFDGETIDMSSFNVGNIAKFTLPLTL